MEPRRELGSPTSSHKTNIFRLNFSKKLHRSYSQNTLTVRSPNRKKITPNKVLETNKSELSKKIDQYQMNL